MALPIYEAKTPFKPFDIHFGFRTGLDGLISSNYSIKMTRGRYALTMPDDVVNATRNEHVTALTSKMEKDHCETILTAQRDASISALLGQQELIQSMIDMLVEDNAETRAIHKKLNAQLKPIAAKLKTLQKEVQQAERAAAKEAKQTKQKPILAENASVNAVSNSDATFTSAVIANEILTKLAAVTFATNEARRLPKNKPFEVHFRVMARKTGAIAVAAKSIKIWAKSKATGQLGMMELPKNHDIYRKIRKVVRYLPSSFVKFNA